jgi:hypothetical protein
MLSGPLHQDAAAASHENRLNQERGEAVAIYGERLAANRDNAGWQHPLSAPDNRYLKRPALERVAGAEFVHTRGPPRVWARIAPITTAGHTATAIHFLARA